jgi:hypothetical protein
MSRTFIPLIASTTLVACVDLGSEESDVSELSSEERASCEHEDHHDGDHRHHRKLALLERIHDRYRDIDVAIADGYELGVVLPNGVRVVAGCVTNLVNPALGAMGYHYFRADRFNDPKIHELRPEVLVYQNDNYAGTFELGAVEWVVPKAAWDAEHGVDAPPPEVYGHEMMILNPVLNWYVGHAWLWRSNPAGLFSDWNPDVTCPPPPP